VLTSRFSASASEIVAGAIKDHRRGLVIGDATTLGKGSVQSLINLDQRLFGGFSRQGPGLGAVKLTIQMFYRPGGESVQVQGVPSDIELPSLTNHLEGISEADLDHHLPANRIDPGRFTPFPFVSPEMVHWLRERSAARIRENARFLQEIRNIDNYLAIRRESMQTLNEGRFFAERDRLNEDREMDRIERRSLANQIERDHYLDEVMAITIDAMAWLRQNRIEFPAERARPAPRSGGFFNLFGG
jgi:carboxyl-terminal processing protease